MMTPKEFLKLRMRADVLDSIEQWCGNRPDTMSIETLQCWHDQCTNKSGFRQTIPMTEKHPQHNPALPIAAKGKYGTVLCFPHWITGGEANPYRVSKGLYRLPWENLDDYTKILAERAAAPKPVVAEQKTVAEAVAEAVKPAKKPKSDKKPKTSKSGKKKDPVAA